jgi:hypothetical protein
MGGRGGRGESEGGATPFGSWEREEDGHKRARRDHFPSSLPS